MDERIRRNGHSGHQSKADDFEVVALALQGGGALGAYQAGVYEALSKAGVTPNWVAGISIGAINSALIAGNPVEKRVERLREFWETVSEPPLGPLAAAYGAAAELPGDLVRQWVNQTRALGVASLGAPGFFTPRIPPSYLWSATQPDKLSIYDTTPLHATLERLVDFDHLNSGDMRLSVGAVNIRNGNFVYFDTAKQKIDLRHILASGSLPPGFPATEIDGQYYWDGGIVSNTPLQWLLEATPRRDTLAFQVDLWSATGDLPRDLLEADVRRKDIQFSSRTREATHHVLHAQRARRAFRAVYPHLPKEIQDSAEGRFLAEQADESAYNIVHLIYHARSYEGTAKDYEFSRRTMEEHWRAGYDAAAKAIDHQSVFERPTNPEGFKVFDFTRGGSGEHR